MYVKNMPIGVTSMMLRKTFRPYGPIVSAKALNPEGPYPGGLVLFVRAEHALKAIEATAEGKITLEGASAPLVVRIAEKKGAKEASAQSEESDEEPPRSRRPVGDLNSLVAEEDIDADVLVAEPLHFVLKLLDEHENIVYTAPGQDCRSGVFSSNFLATRPNSSLWQRAWSSINEKLKNKCGGKR